MPQVKCFLFCYHYFLCLSIFHFIPCKAWRFAQNLYDPNKLVQEKDKAPGDSKNFFSLKFHIHYGAGNLSRILGSTEADDRILTFTPMKTVLQYVTDLNKRWIFIFPYGIDVL